jgi:decaprenylphospho-beta-D-ribofuranose 2-oxidase
MVACCAFTSQRGLSFNYAVFKVLCKPNDSRAGLTSLLRAIADSGAGSFLAVLKLYGPQQGYLPFAMEGYSLALDFPIKSGLFDLLSELDKMVLAYGGRLYLTKDARMSRETFLAGYPQAQTFIQMIRRLNPDARFRSRQSNRLGITR